MTEEAHMTKANRPPSLFRNSQGRTSVAINEGRSPRTACPNSIPEMGSEHRSAFTVGAAKALVWAFIVVGSSTATQTQEPPAEGLAQATGAADVALASSWPDSGPKRLWKRSLGEGESGIVWADGILYTMFRKQRNEHIVESRNCIGRPACGNTGHEIDQVETRPHTSEDCEVP